MGVTAWLSLAMVTLARWAFLSLLFALPFMRPYVEFRGLPVIAGDALYLVAAGALGVAVLARRIRLRWHPLYAPLLAYFVAMLLSAVTAVDPQRAWFKLATQAYLLSLPLLAASLIDDEEDLRRACGTWLAATAVVSAIGALTVLSFYFGYRGPIATFGLHEYGTLPAGHYPRVQATFEYAAMLCNYLSVSLAILLLSLRRGWIRPVPFGVLLVLLGVTASFSLTPGLGGIFLLLGLWGWLLWEAPRKWLSLAAGTGAAAVFVMAATVTPILHTTAPFLIAVPGTDWLVAPSIRFMVWIDSLGTFLGHPLLGVGIGGDSARVAYVDPSGGFRYPMTDAHNVFLDVAAQCGLVGLIALVALIVQVVKQIPPAGLDRRNVLRVGLGTAWLCAFVYQGLTGAYQDARHLWILLGLFIAAERIAGGGGAAIPTSAPAPSRDRR